MRRAWLILGVVLVLLAGGAAVFLARGTSWFGGGLQVEARFRDVIQLAERDRVQVAQVTTAQVLFQITHSSGEGEARVFSFRVAPPSLVESYLPDSASIDYFCSDGIGAIAISNEGENRRPLFMFMDHVQLVDPGYEIETREYIKTTDSDGFVVILGPMRHRGTGRQVGGMVLDRNGQTVHELDPAYAEFHAQPADHGFYLFPRSERRGDHVAWIEGSDEGWQTYRSIELPDATPGLVLGVTPDKEPIYKTADDHVIIGSTKHEIHPKATGVPWLNDVSLPWYAYAAGDRVVELLNLESGERHRYSSPSGEVAHVALNVVDDRLMVVTQRDIILLKLPDDD